MTMISGGNGPSFRIGPTGPTNYARFSNAATPGWGSALAKIGGAFAERHRREQKKAANLAQEAELTTKRQNWMQALGSGSTLRDVAASDPSVLGDSEFLNFVRSTAAKPEGGDLGDGFRSLWSRRRRTKV